MNSVYVIVAYEGYKLKECVVLTDHATALVLYKRLKDIYDEHVAMASVCVDRIPANVVASALGVKEN